jgi:hypothetical protein
MPCSRGRETREPAKGSYRNLVGAGFEPWNVRQKADTSGTRA